MEFRFNISKIFKNNISRIGSSLLPDGFVAEDRRHALDATAYVAEIINSVGQASGSAQGLNQPVTTSDRLRNTDDQVIYLMTEDDGRNGLVVGLLKIGRKSLYVFDKFGETRQVHAPCVLDFYIHESRQRAGLGKVLFEFMLEYECFLPEQMAIDRPSEKLLSFLRKHYALEHKIPQMNNFVIYDGFFASQQTEKEANGSGQMHITSSPNSSLFGPQFVNEDNTRRRSNSHPRLGLPTVQAQALGRYGARRPQCSLNQIIHNKPTSVTSEPNSKSQNGSPTSPAHGQMHNTQEAENEAAEELAQKMENRELNATQRPESPYFAAAADHIKFSDEDQAETSVGGIADGDGYIEHEHQFYNAESEHHQDFYRHKRSTSPFQYNKRQTGKKNISNFVVGSDNKMDFDQTDRGYGSEKTNHAAGYSNPSSYENQNDNESVNSRDSEQTHTADGFFDLKFYSHPLW